MDQIQYLVLLIPLLVAVVVEIILTVMQQDAVVVLAVEAVQTGLVGQKQVVKEIMEAQVIHGIISTLRVGVEEKLPLEAMATLQMEREGAVALVVTLSHLETALA
jgi:hypothetical protein